MVKNIFDRLFYFVRWSNSFDLKNSEKNSENTVKPARITVFSGIFSGRSKRFDQTGNTRIYRKNISTIKFFILYFYLFF